MATGVLAQAEGVAQGGTPRLRAFRRKLGLALAGVVLVLALLFSCGVFDEYGNRLLAERAYYRYLRAVEEHDLDTLRSYMSDEDYYSACESIRLNGWKNSGIYASITSVVDSKMEDGGVVALKLQYGQTERNGSVRVKRAHGHWVIYGEWSNLGGGGY